MKIVSTTRGPWSLRITCRACASVLEIVDTDIYMSELGSGMDDYNRALCYVVDCAVCQHFIELERSSLPEWVLRERRSARKPG